MKTKINSIIHHGSVFFIAFFTCVSCENSLVETEKDDFVINLQIPQSLEITTRGGSLNDITISNVWVLQYSQNDDRLLKMGEFKGDQISNTTTNGTLKVTTSDFVKENSRFYVIANTGDDFFTASETAITEDDLKKKTKAISDYTSEPTFVTAGPVSLTNDSITKYGGKAVIVAPLERAFARIVVQWAASSDLNGSIEIKKVEVVNLPKNMAAYSRGGGSLSSTYPVVSSTEMETNSVVIKDFTSTSNKWEAGQKQKFFMPENLRGMGTASTFSEKNKKEKGPGGKLDGCTYILMTGTYKYRVYSPDGSTYTYSSPIDVQYKIYLGGNLTNDYNIQRGYSYELTVNISGANSADIRVTILNGNVAIFDDVQSITNIVDFN